MEQSKEGAPNKQKMEIVKKHQRVFNNFCRYEIFPVRDKNFKK